MFKYFRRPLKQYVDYFNTLESSTDNTIDNVDNYRQYPLNLAPNFHERCRCSKCSFRFLDNNKILSNIIQLIASCVECHIDKIIKITYRDECQGAESATLHVETFVLMSRAVRESISLLLLLTAWRIARVYYLFIACSTRTYGSLARARDAN